MQAIIFQFAKHHQEKMEGSGPGSAPLYTDLDPIPERNKVLDPMNLDLYPEHCYEQGQFNKILCFSPDG